MGTKWMTPESILCQLRFREFTDADREVIHDMVFEAANQEATNVVNSDLEEQIRYVVERGFDPREVL